ncbi:alkylhydroperoxidase/carboxymuconolactone decarboxylase family protein YurZ [Streptomyces sp. LBL]|nr:alkylhydroperoxidase/carboxymuconolactone decarboxylase family protein YurZ [Streptomyces sp. LBL]
MDAALGHRPRSRTGQIESVSPALAQNDKERVQELWSDDSLSRRDRGLVTIAVLISNGQQAGQDVGVLAVVARGDGAGNDQLGDVDALLRELVVEEAGVGAFSGEGDGCAGAFGVGLDGGTAVDEQHGAPAQFVHAGQDVVHHGDRAADGEREGGLQVGGGGLQDGLHEVLVRDGAVLEDSEIGPRVLVAASSAATSALRSRTSAANPRAVMPSWPSRQARVSRWSWEREIRAMSKPWRATAAPSPGPAPVRANVVARDSWRGRVSGG